MAKLPRFRPAFLRRKTEGSTTSVEASPVGETKQESTEKVTPAVDVEGDVEARSETSSEDLQRGVQDVEAVTKSWSKKALALVFINIWFVYLANAMQGSILYNLIPYVTSDFETHSLLNVIYVVGDAMAAATYIPVSKVMDVWGRAEGFAIMTLFATLGMIMMATCHNLPTFCAAYVFYLIGTSGIIYCVDVITADSSKLKNRGLAYAFTSSPYIITAFAGPKAAEDFYSTNWRWGFGAFAIVFPIVCTPLYFLLKVNLKRAKQHGIAAREKSNRTILQNIWFYAVEFDVVGVFLFSVGLVVFFLPFDIATYAPNGWATGYIIAMIVVGCVMLVVFILWERYLAPTPLLNWASMYNRTVIGACLLDATYQVSFYAWNTYFTSFLQAVNNLSIAEAGYVSHTFDVVSGILLLFVGVLISKTGRFKWMLYISVPLYIFAQGLMIYFRRPNQTIGYLVMCQIFISIGGSIFIIVEQLAILAAVDHQHVAAALALLNVVGTVGGAMGSTICGAIWTNTFPVALKQHLPESAMSNFDLIYGDLPTQMKYPVGSATRVAIQKAYGYAQTRMLAAGTGIMVLSFFWILLIRNIDLSKINQVKGTVF